MTRFLVGISLEGNFVSPEFVEKLIYESIDDWKQSIKDACKDVTSFNLLKNVGETVVS